MRVFVISEPMYSTTHLYLYILNLGSTNVMSVIPEINHLLYIFSHTVY